MAYRLGELINKHGREDWLGPLIDEAGPMVQLQLGDLANLLEVFSKYVHICFLSIYITNTSRSLLLHHQYYYSLAPEKKKGGRLG